MKFLTILLAGLLYSISSLASDNIPESIIEAANDNVYHVYTMNGAGSGFYIGHDRLITACHVVVGEESVILVNNERDIVLTAIVETCNIVNDIAILHLNDDSNNAKAFGLAPRIELEFPKNGAVIYGAGYPKSFGLIIVDGHWQEMYSQLENGELVSLVTAPAMYGDSGSPLLSIVDGEVVYTGIRLGIFSHPTNPEAETREEIDMGFVGHVSYVGVAESIQNEIDNLRL